MTRGELIFDGNEKQIFATDKPEQVIFCFKDVATAFGNIKKAGIARKGIVNNNISSLIMAYLRDNGVDNHFIEVCGEREQLCRKITTIPLQVVVHDYFAGSMAFRLGKEEGEKSPVTIYDLRYNNDQLEDPLINDTQAVALGIVSFDDLNIIYSEARKINDLLSELFRRAGIKLIDMKLEFGRDSSGKIILCDEISPDNCRLWDAATDERLDKDRFRHDMGNIIASYEEVYNRLITVKQ